MAMAPGSETICRRCHKDKGPIKLFSNENNMNPKHMPDPLTDLSMIEQQLICKISPCINVHMLKHGGIASSGHCVTFPQDINEPAQIFPRLPEEINIIKVRKRGRNDTSKDFRVRRYRVQNALIWLKENNPVYSDIFISQERVTMLPLDGECAGIPTVEVPETTQYNNDKGPASEQTDPADENYTTHSSVILPDAPVNIQAQVQNIVSDVLGETSTTNNVTADKRGTCTIPWPTRDSNPVSEYTTVNFFTLAFPCLFPYGSADFFASRAVTCSSLSEWADHLLWYEDGRFAHHQYFKFVIHNIIMRKRAAENSQFIVQQKLGDKNLTAADLKKNWKMAISLQQKKFSTLGQIFEGHLNTGLKGGGNLGL